MIHSVLMRGVILGLFLLILGCGDGKKYHDDDQSEPVLSSNNDLTSIIEFQRDLNKEFSDPVTSPLPDRYRKDFNGLDFFKPDTTFVVNATFTRTPDAIPFLMPTNTDRMSKEVIFGIVSFQLKGNSYQLEVYQNEELKEDEGYEDYLFLPFTDATNGNETYEGGRYIDLRIPEGDEIVIDFNKAYNPYCTYNKKYSCPIVPSQNALDIEIFAGVKAFK
ncbi:DUF1684 domain-containing protein [uncultured Muriicola sp.]|uniref:DUF1684 domain-containing protein n=1 Tax=uncultured Muriicola sp. TaxID=1583102 RepID=UPI0026232705|nr:DUF1684 domain-containing protein [uncultured Muriicola sp.]